MTRLELIESRLKTYRENFAWSLVEDIEFLIAHNKKLRAALEFYAAGKHGLGDTNFISEGGDIARQALSEIGEK